MLRELAEYPNAYGPLGPDDVRVDTPRYTLWMGDGESWNTVQRQRFRAEEVDDVVREVRERLRERGRRTTQWEIGSTAHPPSLVELLLDRGLVHDDEPHAAALVLRSAPPPPDAGLEARRVETFDDYLAANEVQWEAFGMTADKLEEARALLERRWRRRGAYVVHVVLLDGEIVAAGTCAPTPHGLLLYGGATRPDARGRGAYRALVAARWREAAARGTPVLATQAGKLSRPILERLGFERVGAVDILRDDFA